MAGCNKDAEYFTLESPADQMKITASAEDVVLQKAEETETAITFNWAKATDRGPDVELVYYIRLVHAEMKDLQSELIKIGSETFSMSWTNRELNNLLHAWNITPGNQVPILVELFAAVENSEVYMMPEVSKTTFNLVGYDPSNKLFLTIVSGNQKRNLQMEMLDKDIYNWKGELTDCEFWFVRNIENGLPAYMKGETESSVVYSITGEGSHFTAENLGYYDITINVNTLEATISSTPINRLFLVTSKGGIETVTALNEAAVGTDIFYLKDVFEVDTEFRFIRSHDVPWPAYAKGADASTLALKNEGDEMFTVDKTATYVMTVNMQDLSLIFLDVYVSPSGNIGVVGDAVVDAGWNAGAAIENCKLTQKDLVNRPEVVSYTGNFAYKSEGSENAFKFVGDANWGMGIFAQIANANPFDVNQQDATLDGGGDRKWQLPNTTVSGIYTLELNLHTMKINFIKL
jgi:hypothetical protein